MICDQLPLVLVLPEAVIVVPSAAVVVLLEVISVLCGGEYSIIQLQS